MSTPNPVSAIPRNRSSSLTEIVPADPAAPCPIQMMPFELAVTALSFLPDIKHVPSIEPTCKYLKSASDENSLWKIRLKQMFNSVNPMPLSPLSVREQVEIYFKKYTDQFRTLSQSEKKLLKKIQILRGPDGFSGAIDRAWKLFEQAVDEKRKRLEFPDAPWRNFTQEAESLYALETQKPCKHLPNPIEYDELRSNPDEYFLRQYERLKTELTMTVGNRYNGTPGSLISSSALGIVQAALRALPARYNNQAAFNEIVDRQSQPNPFAPI